MSAAFRSAAFHRYAAFVSAATFILVFAGGLVTSTGSGLAVPDWPLSFGMLFPPMVGGVLFEHGHRLIAASVGLLVVGLYIWSFFLGGDADRRRVNGLAGLALAAVVLQGLLGGLTVLMKLPPAVSVAHACLAQAFLCLTVAVATMTGRGWERAGVIRESGPGVPLRVLALATTAAVFMQLILGATMRHLKTGLAIPDFPLAFGRIVPPLETFPVQIHFAHRVGACVVSALALWTVSRILRVHRDEPLLRRPAVLLLTLLSAQITLGALTIWTEKAVVPTTAHVLGGAAVLAAGFLIILRASRLIERRPRGASVGVPRQVVA